MPTCQLHLEKERFKFSAAHMTVFPDGTKEGLHGHNYQVRVTIDVKAGTLIPFARLKAPIEELCADWDEKLLLPTASRFLKIQAKTKKETDFRLCGARYVVPSDELCWLETESITSESLAQLFCEKYVKILGPISQSLKRVKVRIDETPGQGASFTWSAEKK